MDITKRKLGKTGVEVTILGLGARDSRSEDKEFCITLCQRASHEDQLNDSSAPLKSFSAIFEEYP